MCTDHVLTKQNMFHLFIAQGHMGCLHPLAVVNDAAGYVVLFETLVSMPFSTLPRRGMAGPYPCTILANFLHV